MYADQQRGSGLATDGDGEREGREPGQRGLLGKSVT